jgi:hypothetical protein
MGNADTAKLWKIIDGRDRAIRWYKADRKRLVKEVEKLEQEIRNRRTYQ